MTVAGQRQREADKEEEEAEEEEQEGGAMNEGMAAAVPGCNTNISTYSRLNS